MVTIEEYVRPQSIAEAYTLLTTRDNAAIVGGGFFMRLASRKIGVAIDLSQAGLDFIRETDDHIEIGAMTTCGQLEQHAVFHNNLDGIIPAAVANLPGVQMKNMVTVGGTIFGKYGFSELLTALVVLDCQVVLHKNGKMGLNDFLAMKGKPKDIMEQLIIQKEKLRACYQMFRNSAGSLPMLSVAVSKNNQKYKIAVGGRPGVAVSADEAMSYLVNGDQNQETLEKAADIASSELEFANDRRASAEYRRLLCQVLVKRALMEVQK
jgi:CO/xanthine dehydrogenase FAD-binding subunit